MNTEKKRKKAGKLPVSAGPPVDKVISVQIPRGLKPGDSFLATQPSNEVVTVIVPEGAFPGAYIDVTIPGEKKGDKDATPGNNLSCCAVRKTTVAAGVIGGICGAILVGPIGCLAGGVLLASCGSVASTCKDQLHKGNDSGKDGEEEALTDSNDIHHRNWLDVNVNKHNKKTYRSDSASVSSTELTAAALNMARILHSSSYESNLTSSYGDNF